MKKFNKIIPILFTVIIIALLVFANCFVTTHQNEYTVVRQFGKIVDITETPGLSFKIPLIQSASKLPNCKLMYDLPVSDVITKDKKTMVVDSFTVWEISDPQKFIQTLSGSIANAESRLSAIIYSATKNTISGINQNDVISGRDGELTTAIYNSIGDAAEQYGITILSIETKHLDLPDDNKAAVYNRMISERNNITAGYKAQGESDAKKIRSEADKEISILLSEANAKAEVLEAEGEAEYMRILSDAYASTEKAEFYNFVRSLDAAKASLGKDGNVLIIDRDSPLADIFYSDN